MNRKNDLHPFIFEQSVHTAVVIACFEAFSKTLKKKTVVIMDNASVHSLPDTFTSHFEMNTSEVDPSYTLSGERNQSRRSRRCVTTSAGIVPYGMS
jgi:hypothetical protein